MPRPPRVFVAFSGCLNGSQVRRSRRFASSALLARPFPGRVFLEVDAFELFAQLVEDLLDGGGAEG